MSQATLYGSSLPVRGYSQRGLNHHRKPSTFGDSPLHFPIYSHNDIGREILSCLSQKKTPRLQRSFNQLFLQTLRSTQGFEPLSNFKFSAPYEYLGSVPALISRNSIAFIISIAAHLLMHVLPSGATERTGTGETGEPESFHHSLAVRPG